MTKVFDRNYFRLDKIAGLDPLENLFIHKTKKRGWRIHAIGDIRKRGRGKKMEKWKGVGSGARDRWKFPASVARVSSRGIQSGSLLASERQRDARTENKVAAAIGLALLLS